MGRLSLPKSEHNKIRTSPGIRAELVKIAARIADEAGRIADDQDGYGTDLTVGTDRARAHVWPESGPALGAEIKNSPLMQVVGNMGVS